MGKHNTPPKTTVPETLNTKDPKVCPRGLMRTPAGARKILVLYRLYSTVNIMYISYLYLHLTRRPICPAVVEDLKRVFAVIHDISAKQEFHGLAPQSNNNEWAASNCRHLHLVQPVSSLCPLLDILEVKSLHGMYEVRKSIGERESSLLIQR